MYVMGMVDQDCVQWSCSLWYCIFVCCVYIVLYWKLVEWSWILYWVLDCVGGDQDCVFIVVCFWSVLLLIVVEK